MKFANSKKHILASTIAFLSTGGLQQGVLAAQSENNQEDGGYYLEEIVVTATKRAESIQDVPASITALSSEVIDKKGLVSMDDYLRVLPGVNMVEQGAGRKNPIVMRGIAADPQGEDGTVGIYFGEVPLTAPAAGIGADWLGAPDIKLVDIERVEVLRGPQGTLFGSGSMGGTVRIIPATPDLEDYQANLTTGYSQTDKAGGANYLAKGMVSFPIIEDQLALRAVAYRFKNSGYVKNVAGNTNNTFMNDARVGGGTVVNVDDIGRDSYTGGRISALWVPNDTLKVTLAHMYQETDQKGLPEVELPLGTYEQARAQVSSNLSGGNGLDSKTGITNLQIDYDFGFAQLLSSSSYADFESEFRRDASYSFGGPIDQGVSGSVEMFTQEVRLASSLDGSVQFLLGVYYEDVESDVRNQNFWSGDPSLNFYITGTAFDPQFVDLPLEQAVEQKAIFGEISYDILEELTVTLGGRAFDYTKKQRQQFVVPAFSLLTDESDQNKESGENFKANISYKPSEDHLIYAQWAEGFRLGRPLAPLISTPTCDPDGDGRIVSASGALVEHADNIESDNLESFELGSKLTFLNNRIQLNGAIYHINWDGIPITVLNAAGSCAASQNAGRARSRGAEFESVFLLTDSIIAEAGFSYVDAELVEDAGTLGNKSDRLPGSPKFNANAALQYEFSLSDIPGYVRADYAYVGGFYNNLQEVGVEAGKYHQLNLKGGLHFRNVNIDVYANNITNSDDITWVNSVLTTDARAYRLRPRTIGMQFTWTY